MSLIDWEAVVHDLEEYMASKDGNSFGQRELTDKLTELRIKHRIPEGLVERVFRLFDDEVQEILERGQSDTTGVEAQVEMAR